MVHEFFSKPYNVRVIPDAGDVVIVGADTIAKLSAETSENRSVAAWDQRIVTPLAPLVPVLAKGIHLADRTRRYWGRKAQDGVFHLVDQ